jgi:hypothetical protein
VSANALLNLTAGFQELFADPVALATVLPQLQSLFQAELQTPQRVTVIPFPTPKIDYNSFYARAARLFGFLFAFTFLFPSTRLLQDIVVEKEARLREGMRIMGLTSAELMVSWFITYAAITLLQCIPIALIAQSLVFKVSSCVFA